MRLHLYINTLEGSGQELHVAYPPDYAPLTPEEKTAVKNLKLSDEALSGLKKIILDARRRERETER